MAQPSFNDREYDLWKKLVGNTGGITPIPPPPTLPDFSALDFAPMDFAT